MTKKPLLQLKILSSDKNIFNAEVKSVSSTNSSGKFDILPNHQNFISLIFGQVTVTDAKGKRNILHIEHALLKCINNQIEIYLGLDKI